MLPMLAQPGDATALCSAHTSNLPLLFEQLGASLVVSTNQAGKVIVVRNDGGALNTRCRTFAEPIGSAANCRWLVIVHRRIARELDRSACALFGMDESRLRATDYDIAEPVMSERSTKWHDERRQHERI